MRVGIIGSGSWGMTLAILLQSKGHETTVWFYDAEEMRQAQDTHKLPDYLPGIDLPTNLTFTSNMQVAAMEKDMVVVAIPSHTVRTAIASLDSILEPETIMVNVAKGIENDSLKTMSQVLADILPAHDPNRITSLYGPTHAEEVVRGMPSTIVSAGPDQTVTRIVQEAFRTETFRVYTNEDLLGVELGGSLKNVIAIAAGILAGMGFGDNTLAALLTRGAFEITRLGVHLGAREQTFAGLSGMGDLIVTCLSTHSRNRHVGFELGKGRALEAILADMKMVAEGINTARSVHQLYQKTGVDMPISEQIYHVLFKDKPARNAVADLMERDPVPERHSID